MAAITRLSKSSSITISYLSRCLSSAVASEANSPYKSLFPPKPNLKLIRKDPEDRNVQWVFLGCPGVGKGTYASRLCKLLGVPHIATGDLVREELASSGPLSQQVLLSRSVICFLELCSDSDIYCRLFFFLNFNRMKLILELVVNQSRICSFSFVS